MSLTDYEIRQCSNESCRFRYPISASMSEREVCPNCGSPANLVLNPTPTSELLPLKLEKNEKIVEGFLDNIRSAYNVGAIFRTADGAGVRHLHLAGITPTPFHPKVRKTALGSEKVVPWTHHRNGLDTVADQKSKGYKVVAIERSPVEHSLFEYAYDDRVESPILLIVGNEITGIDRGILDICDSILAIPMVGSKESLNVEVSFGIAAYHLRFNPG